MRTRTSGTRTTTSPRTEAATAPTGLLVVDKPGGWTSHQVVGRVRRLLGTRKVGHAGTLDPMATGVLVVGVGRATRLLGLLSLTDKAYTATIRLGAATVTDDAEGEMTAVTDAAGITERRVADTLTAFRGDLLQVPSSVSAIKVGGVRSYARVRAGEGVELAARPVRVERFDLLTTRTAEVDGVTMIDCDVVVECSTGTYVRALARDLGTALGVGGHLTRLRRTRVGPFTLAEAVPLGDDAPALLGLGEVARRCFPVLVVDDETAGHVRFGRSLDLALASSPTALVDGTGDLLALYLDRDGRAAPLAVFVTAGS